MKDASEYNADMKVKLPSMKKIWRTNSDGFQYFMWVFAR